MANSLNYLRPNEILTFDAILQTGCLLGGELGSASFRDCAFCREFELNGVLTARSNPVNDHSLGKTLSGGLVPGGLIERMKAMIFHSWSELFIAWPIGGIGACTVP